MSGDRGIMEMGLQTDAGLKSQGYLVSRGIHQPKDHWTIGWQFMAGHVATECHQTHWKIRIILEIGGRKLNTYPVNELRNKLNKILKIHENTEHILKHQLCVFDVCAFETKDYMIRRSPFSLQMLMGWEPGCNSLNLSVWLKWPSTSMNHFTRRGIAPRWMLVSSPKHCISLGLGLGTNHPQQRWTRQYIGWQKRQLKSINGRWCRIPP